VKIEQVSGFTQLEIRHKREGMARHKINADDINSLIETAVGGKVATTLFEGQRRFDVLVRFPETSRNTSERIGSLMIRSPAGYDVPLSELADIEEVEVPAQISREDSMRRLLVECNIRGRDMGSFVAEAREKLAAVEKQLPIGYRLALGGQFENQQRAMRRLGIILPATIGLIVFLLYLTFGALRPALLILLNLPFALVGGVLSLAISGLYLSVPASVGFIALFGIAVLNGIVLLSYIIQLREEGLTLDEAVVRGGSNRLRPVLMTATITIFSLLPLLFAQGPGSEIQKPLAVVVVGGLVTSTLMTLLVLPALYAWSGAGRKRTPKEESPAKA